MAQGCPLMRRQLDAGRAVSIGLFVTRNGPFEAYAAAPHLQSNVIQFTQPSYVCGKFCSISQMCNLSPGRYNV
jgi:hypothetical protein